MNLLRDKLINKCGINVEFSYFFVLCLKDEINKKINKCNISSKSTQKGISVTRKYFLCRKVWNQKCSI